MSDVTEMVVSAYLEHTGPWEDVILLHINHGMKNSYRLNEQLLRICRALVFVAVPYRDHPHVEVQQYPSYYGKKSRDRWKLCRNEQEIGEAEGGFSTVMEMLLSEAVRQDILPGICAGKKLLIFEDGGHHFAVFEKLAEQHPELKEAVLGGVEQTMSGTRNSFGYRSYPVLSVARSRYKMRFEAYFIAVRAVEEIYDIMRQREDVLPLRDIVLIGYGIIGRNVALQLKAYHPRIRVYDQNPQCLEVAAADGFEIVEADFAFSEQTIVIGNSGRPSFTEAMLERFIRTPDAIRLYLASTSSGQKEFAEVMPRLTQYECKKHKEGTVFQTGDGKEVFLCADGFPVNLYNPEKESLNYAMIDPVFAGMVQLLLYLKEHHETLGRGTRLLGPDPLLAEAVDEDVLIDAWLQQNRIRGITSDWNVHPLEEKLGIMDRPGQFRKQIDNKKEELADLLEEAEKFCEEQGIDGRRRYYTLLCIEELVVNIISYGYADDHRHMIDIAIKAGEHLCLTIQDDATRFDPTLGPEADVQASAEEREIGGLGIHLVRQIAKEFRYRRNGSYNTLRIIL